MPPTEAGKIARVVVVDDVGAGDEWAEDGRVLAGVGVFDPVGEARDKVGEQDGGKYFE